MSRSTRKRKGFAGGGLGDGGEKQPHTEHSILLLPKFPLGISVHSRLLACQPAIPLPSHAASLGHCRSPAVLPPGSLCSPWPWTIRGLQGSSSHLWPLGIHAPQKEIWKLKIIFLFFKFLYYFFSVTRTKTWIWTQVFRFYSCATSIKLHNLFTTLVITACKHGDKTNSTGPL